MRVIDCGDIGTLAEWTKGFSASGVVGKDVVELLQKAFARKVESTLCATVCLCLCVDNVCVVDCDCDWALGVCCLSIPSDDSTLTPALSNSE